MRLSFHSAWTGLVLASLLLSGCAADGGGDRKDLVVLSDGSGNPETASRSQGGAESSHNRTDPIKPVVPKRVEVPAIGVSASVIRLGLNTDGTLEVPQDYSLTGWWSEGVAPGENGPAVIVGHVDSHTGPAVFFRLQDVTAGDTIKVAGRAGRTLRFAIDRVEQHPKDRFPTERVYGDTSLPTLRLITCGGEFDGSSGHYLDNVIVFASLVRARP